MSFVVALQPLNKFAGVSYACAQADVAASSLLLFFALPSCFKDGINTTNKPCCTVSGGCSTESNHKNACPCQPLSTSTLQHIQCLSARTPTINPLAAAPRCLLHTQAHSHTQQCQHSRPVVRVVHEQHKQVALVSPTDAHLIIQVRHSQLTW